MHTRNIQTFLMVSAAFFAMSAPVRSGSAGTLSNAVARIEQFTPARISTARVASSSSSSQAGKDDQNS